MDSTIDSGHVLDTFFCNYLCLRIRICLGVYSAKERRRAIAKANRPALPPPPPAEPLARPGGGNDPSPPRPPLFARFAVFKVRFQMFRAYGTHNQAYEVKCEKHTPHDARTVESKRDRQR